MTAFARTLSQEAAQKARVQKASSLAQLFRESDIVSLHLPLTKETRGLVNRDLIDLMKKGAMLINTARAEVVDEAALIEAAEAGRIRVGTDVFGGEPEGKSGAFQHRLAGLPNVYGTHHIGASTEQAQAEIADAAVAQVRTFIESGEIQNAVNILLTPPIQGTLVIRHLDRVGVLASVLTALKGAEINVETMENIVFAGGVAACARIRVAQRPSEDVVGQIRGLEHIISVELI